MSILLVEDDRPFVELLRHWLGKREIRVAHSLAQAKEMISDYPPKYLVLDLALPDSPPSKTLAQIRQFKDAAKDAIVIVITGYDASRKVAYDHGADLYFPKGEGFFEALSGAITEHEISYRSKVSDTVKQVEEAVKAIVAPPPPPQ